MTPSNAWRNWKIMCQSYQVSNMLLYLSASSAFHKNQNLNFCAQIDIGCLKQKICIKKWHVNRNQAIYKPESLTQVWNEMCFLSQTHTYPQIVCICFHILAQWQTNALVIPGKCFRALNNWTVHRISGEFLTHSCGLLPCWKAAFETWSRILGTFCIVSFTLCWNQLPFSLWAWK